MGLCWRYFDPETAQPLTGSMMDYTVTRADDMPMLNTRLDERAPTPTNPLGVKGCGEAGAIGSPPAVVNAVIDALQSGGKNVTHIDMPLTPARVWEAMNNA